MKKLKCPIVTDTRMCINDAEMGQPHVGWRKRMHDAGHVAISAWDAFYVRVSPTSTGGSKR